MPSRKTPLPAAPLTPAAARDAKRLSGLARPPAAKAAPKKGR